MKRERCRGQGGGRGCFNWQQDVGCASAGDGSTSCLRVHCHFRPDVSRTLLDFASARASSFQIYIQLYTMNWYGTRKLPSTDAPNSNT